MVGMRASKSRLNSNSRARLPTLRIVRLTENSPIRVFPIGYGKGAEWEVLSRIAEATQTKAYKGETKDIEKIFRQF